jgi:MFS family permease
VISFVSSLALVADPLMVFERRLVGIERKVDFTCRGVEVTSKLIDGVRWNGSFKQDSFLGFAIAIVLFSLATSLFFTPLPIYLKELFNGQEQLVYLAYILNSIGGIAGYFLIRRTARFMDIKKQMPRYIFLSSLLIFALIAVISLALLPILMTGILLLGLGFAYAMYYIMMISLSMELIPQGRAGLFDGLVSLGAGVGAFFGPFLAFNLNYLPTFIIAATIFLVAYLTLKVLR